MDVLVNYVVNHLANVRELHKVIEKLTVIADDSSGALFIECIR